jgi:hypothetical protein
VVAIQKKLVKWGKRNAVSRRFHAKNNKETIAIWKLDLDKILQVFNVCPVIRVKTSVTLTLRFQREFTRPIVSTIPHDVTNTHTVIYDARNDVAKTHTSVSDIRHNALKSPQDTHGQDRMVNITRTPPVTEYPLNVV